LGREAWLEWNRSRRTHTLFDEALRSRITARFLEHATDAQCAAWRERERMEKGTKEKT